MGVLGDMKENAKKVADAIIIEQQAQIEAKKRGEAPEDQQPKTTP